MNALKNLAIILFCLCLLPSCTDIVDKTMEGMWTIDEIYYKGLDAQYCFYSNYIQFDKENVRLPFGDLCFGVFSKNERGTWGIYKTDSIPLVLNIETTNSIFSGTHQIIFFKDEKDKWLKVEISSKDIYIIARKDFYSYDDNIGVINDLIEMGSVLD